jgi:hypothetical protein
MALFGRPGTYTRNPVADGECQYPGCIYCSSGIGHAPMVVVYEPANGDYAEAPEEICIARHASAGRGYSEDDICGSPVGKWAGDVPLCELHFERLMKWFAAEDEATIDRALGARRRLHEQQLRNEEELDRKRHERAIAQVAAMALAKSPYSVVYYVRRASDGAVKIGFSASIENRMAAIRREHGPLEILLVLGGDREEESDAHNKFQKYRIGRTEWFRPVRTLLDWIVEARDGHTYHRVQPDNIIRLNELRRLAAAAVPEEDLQWDDDGILRWPPDAAAA